MINILTIDFETLDKYLRKTSKANPMGGLGAGWIYKNKDNFKVLGVSLKEDNGEPYYLDLTQEKNIGILKSKVSQSKVLVAHNASYELGILWRLGIGWDDKVVLDTETIARIYMSEEKEYSLGYLAKKYLTNTRKVKDTLGKAAFDKGLCRWKTYDEKKCSKWALENMDIMQQECYDVVAYYANMDVQATYELFKFYMSSAKLHHWNIDKFKEICIEKSMLCKASVWMRTRGVRVDLKKLREVRQQYTPILASLAQKIYDEAGEEFEIGGKLDKIRIFDKLGIKYPTTEKGNPSFTGDWLSEQDHPLCQAIADYNECKKNYNDFILKIEEIQQFTLDLPMEEVDKLDYGIVYPEINVMRARTGRFSCRGPNLQQIPSSKIWGPLCRSIYVPHEGETMYSLDWASQENRIMIDLAYKNNCEGAEEYVLAFNKDHYLDIHMMVANLMGLSCGNNPENDKEHCKICKDGRGPAKTIGLGLAYAMGILKLAKGLGLFKGLPELSVPLEDIISDLRKNKGKPKKTSKEDYRLYLEHYDPKISEARELVSKYKKASQYIVSLSEKSERQMKIKGYVETEMGRRIHKDAPIWVDGQLLDFGYKAFNKLIQGSAADDTGRVMVECYKRKIPILLPIHDQFLLSTSNKQDAFDLKDLMENSSPRSIPYCVDMDENGGQSWDTAGH